MKEHVWKAGTVLPDGGRDWKCYGCGTEVTSKSRPSFAFAADLGRKCVTFTLWTSPVQRLISGIPSDCDEAVVRGVRES